MNTQQRPVFQAVLKYRYPVTAIVSVLHRVSGVILFLLIPLLLWALAVSLNSPSGFAAVQGALGNCYLTALIGLILAALLYHLLAGIRHIIMDMGFAESLKGGRVGAYAVLIIAVLFIVLAGVWLC